MRARLNTMAVGQEFSFLCLKKMADRMDRVVALGGGEVFEKDVRSYGVVVSVRKTELDL